MEAIYSCKLFQNSSRKQAIKAAIQDPLNVELVTQLREYLDPEYVESPEPDVSEKTSEISDNPDKDGVPARSSDVGHIPTPGFSKPSGGDDSQRLSDRYADDLEAIEDENPVDLPIKSETTEDDVAVESATEIDSLEPVCGEAVDTATLKDALCESYATEGVQRIRESESELWIYYVDSVNLNKIMSDVIDYIQLHYPQYQFNRLARTDNAIVFVK